MFALAWPVAFVVVFVLAHHAAHSALAYLRDRAKLTAVEVQHMEALAALRRHVEELEKALNLIHNARVVASQDKRLGPPRITGL